MAHPRTGLQSRREGLSAARSRTHTGGAAMSVMVELDHLSKNFGAEAGGERCQPRGRARRIRHAAGPVRLRQDHDLALHCRAGAAGRRRNPHRRRRGRSARARRLSQPGRPQHRHGVPELRGLAAHDRVRQCRLRPARAARAGRRDQGAHHARRSNWSACRISPIATPRNSPAASASAWRSRAPSSTSRA